MNDQAFAAIVFAAKAALGLVVGVVLYTISRSERLVAGRYLSLGFVAFGAVAAASLMRSPMREAFRFGVSGLLFMALGAVIFLRHRQRHSVLSALLAGSALLLSATQITMGARWAIAPRGGAGMFATIAPAAELLFAIVCCVALAGWYLEASQVRAAAAEPGSVRHGDDVNHTQGLLARAMASVADSVVVVNRELRIEACNEAFAVGFTRNTASAAVGRSLLEVVPPDRLSAWREHLEATLQGTPRQFEVTIAGPRRRAVLDVSMTPIREGEQVSGAVVAGRDITDRVAALAREKQSREHFLRLFEGGSDIIAVVDATGRFTFVSSAVREVLGWSESDLVGEHPVGFVHPEDAVDTEKMVRAAFENSPGRFMVSFRFRTKAGEWRTLEGAGRLERDLDGHGVVAITARDVTERETLRTQLMQRSKLESIGRLAGGVAHDFNNLLTSILASTEMAREALPEGHIAEADLLEVRAAGLRAAELTKQLLAFARRDVSRPRVLDLNVTVRGLASMLQRLLGERVTLSLELAAAPVQVNADRSQLEQVIVNLAVNARDAMPNGGRVTIRTGRHHGMRLDEPREWAMIAVEDSGVGMTEDVRKRIFEPFFTTKEAGRGTGLGLAMCYGIVTRHGGKIEVVSAPGDGTCMQVLLPELERAIADTEPLDPGNDRRAFAGSETLLLVEDDDRVRDVTARLLRRSGYVVHEASGGRAALEQLDVLADCISLVVSDVVMPDMDGTALADTLHQRFPDLPVILTTGYPGDALRRAKLERTETPVLRKPYESAELLGEVRRLLDGIPREGPVLRPDGGSVPL